LGVQALAVVDNGPLAQLLGDCEGPSHDDWDTTSERPPKNWREWKGRVRFVRDIVREAVRALSPPPEAPDRDLLRDYFSIPRPAGSRPDAGRVEAPEGAAHLPNIEATRWYAIREVKGGFVVHDSKQKPIPADASLRVQVAYDLDRGDPFKAWTPFDFVLGDNDRQPTATGVKATLRRSGNCVELHGIESGFRFRVQGFDLNRDLKIKIDDLNADADGEQ
jgi:hypothetical protein